MDPDAPRVVMVEAPRLADRLVAIMDQRNLSLRELAQQSGLDKETINKWCLGGPAGVRLEKVEQLAGALSVEVTDLLGGSIEHPAAAAAAASRSRAKPLATERLAEEVEASAERFLKEVKRSVADARSQEG